MVLIVVIACFHTLLIIIVTIIFAVQEWNPFMIKADHRLLVVIGAFHGAVDAFIRFGLANAIGTAFRTRVFGFPLVISADERLRLIVGTLNFSGCAYLVFGETGSRIAAIRAFLFKHPLVICTDERVRIVLRTFGFAFGARHFWFSIA